MRRSIKISSGLVGMALLAASFASADAPAAKWYDSIAASGYLQTSYVGNFQSSPHNPNNQGRQFDTNGNSFSLNSFLLQLAKPVGDADHYGFTVRLRTGQDAAALNTATGSNGGNFAVQEAYMTYVVPAMSKLSFIGGRFVTSEGYEVVDSVNNPNFSEGLLFTYAEPINHTGVKANYVVNDKVNATLGLVNGWNSDPDVNGGKTIIWQVATTPTKAFAWSFQGTYGNEIADNSAVPTASHHSDVTSLDTVATYTMGKLSLAGQLNWGQQSDDPSTALGKGTSHWSGLGLWASFAETDKCTTSARFEVMGDQNNANRFGVGAPGNVGSLTGSSNTNQTIKEFTLTQKHMLTTAMGVRAEYRHDWSNEAYFFRKDGSTVRNQNTVSADWFVTF